MTARSRRWSRPCRRCARSSSIARRVPVLPPQQRESMRDGLLDGPERLRLEDVSIDYGAKKAVKSVSLSIHQGEVLALIGPSGCGKTTLLRTLNRLTELTPSASRAGRVLLDGEDIHEMADTTLRSRVAMVFQQPNPFPMSIFDNVAFALREQSRKRPRRRELEPLVIDALKRAGLYDEVGDDLDRPALRLSGGQQQRLCIARAIAPRPEVLLMDEPCSALDPISTATIEKLIGELRRDLAVVVVTHNLAQAHRIADKVAFMYLGDLVEYGTHVGGLRRTACDAHARLRAGSLRMIASRSPGAAMRPGVLKRALVVVGCGALTVTASACESTESESAKIAREGGRGGGCAERAEARRGEPRRARRGRDAAEQRRSHGGRRQADREHAPGAARTCRCSSTSPALAARCSIRTRQAASKRALQRIALLRPHASAWWVDDQVLVSRPASAVKVRVGTGASPRSTAPAPVLTAKTHARGRAVGVEHAQRRARQRLEHGAGQGAGVRRRVAPRQGRRGRSRGRRVAPGTSRRLGAVSDLRSSAIRRARRSS